MLAARHRAADRHRDLLANHHRNALRHRAWHALGHALPAVDRLGVAHRLADRIRNLLHAGLGDHVAGLIRNLASVALLDAMADLVGAGLDQTPTVELHWQKANGAELCHREGHAARNYAWATNRRSITNSFSCPTSE